MSLHGIFSVSCHSTVCKAPAHIYVVCPAGANVGLAFATANMARTVEFSDGVMVQRGSNVSSFLLCTSHTVPVLVEN